MKCDTLHDVIIIGGGAVGAVLALALSTAKLAVLLVDARDDPTDRSDPRTFALSYGSRLILERIGVWQRISSATPIASIHVSQRGGFGRAVLKARDVALPALGYVASHDALQRALLDALQPVSSVTMLRGFRVNLLEPDATSIRAELESSSKAARVAVAAKLAVVADGGATPLGRTSTRVHDYGQSALVANVQAAKPHQNWAFERFTANGPLALLPRSAGFALIWTTLPDIASELCAIPEPVFLTSLQTTFGEYAGAFTAVESRIAFPLALRVATPPILSRTLLLGNAAQTLHPAAGQGLNLGLRDAWELAEHIHQQPGDPGSRPLLSAYTNRRRNDRSSTVWLTDALVRVFSNTRFPMPGLRGCGLTLLDSLPPANRAFMRQMMFGSAW